MASLWTPLWKWFHKLNVHEAPDGPVNFGSQRAINLAEPTENQDAATKNYVDNLNFNARYGVATDITERTTTSTDYIWENNLICQINVKNNDIVEVTLEGCFWNPDARVIAQIEKYSGEASSIQSGTYLFTNASSYGDFSGMTKKLWRATADGILEFRMKWKAWDVGTAHCRYRAMVAKVIGKYSA